MKRQRTEFNRDHTVWWQAKMSTHPRIMQLQVDAILHKNARVVHLPGLYRTFLEQQPPLPPGRRQSHIDANKRKIAALQDVLSFLNAISIGVIR